MGKTRKSSVKMNNIHFKTLVCRYTRQIVSSIPSFLMMIFEVPIMLIVVRLIYVKDCFNVSNTPQNFYTANTILFVLVFIGALMGLLNSYREITKERDILTREISGGLDPISYAFSKLFVLGVISAIQALMLCFGSLTFVNFNFAHPFIDFVLYLATIFLVILASSSIGLLISSIVKKSETAILPVLIIIICQVVFSGMFFDLSKPLEIFSYILPARWGCSILGKIVGINANPFALVKPIYNIKLIPAFIILFLITVVCYTLTITIIKSSTARSRNK